MISLIIIPFIIGFISFLTPTGPVTITIFKNTLLGKYSKSIMILLGATIIQFIFSITSLALVNKVISENLTFTFKIISSLVFLTLGCYLLISKPKKSNQIINLKELPKKEKLKSFLTGLLLTLLNPTIILSWIAIIALLISFNYLTATTFFEILIFGLSAIAGIATGSLILIFLTHKYKKLCSDKFVKTILKFLGTLIISTSIYLISTILF